MKMEDAEFWQNPERLAKLSYAGTVLKTNDAPNVEFNPLHRSRSRFFVLGDPNDDESPTAIVLQLPPGYGLPYHAHPADITMLVVKGSLYVPGRVLYPGDCQVAKAHEFYGPEVAGPDGCVRVEFFKTLKGATSVEYRTPDGDEFTWSSLVDGQAPWRVGMESYPELLSAVLEEARGRDSRS